MTQTSEPSLVASPTAATRPSLLRRASGLLHRLGRLGPLAIAASVLPGVSVQPHLNEPGKLYAPRISLGACLVRLGVLPFLLIIAIVVFSLIPSTAHFAVKFGARHAVRDQINRETGLNWGGIAPAWGGRGGYGIVGTFHSVSEQHLQRYATEFDYRWNTRQSLGFDDTARSAVARTYTPLAVAMISVKAARASRTRGSSGSLPSAARIAGKACAVACSRSPPPCWRIWFSRSPTSTATA